jgi:hypothetical protein
LDELHFTSLQPDVPLLPFRKGEGEPNERFWEAGVKGFDRERAYRAIKTTALDTDYDSVATYSKLGWVPRDLENESVSKTLEHAFDDYCIAQMAKALGKSEDYAYFMKRAGSYKNVFDPVTSQERGNASFERQEVHHAGRKPDRREHLRPIREAKREELGPAVSALARTEERRHARIQQGTTAQHCMGDGLLRAGMMDWIMRNNIISL